MNESANMTSAVDAALDRVRGELVTLERAVAVLRGSIDDRGIPVGGQNLNWKSIDDSPGAARDWPGLHGVGQVLSKELWLPEYGAIQAPDDRG